MYQRQKYTWGGLLVGGLHDDGATVAARKLPADLFMLEVMLADDGEYLFRRNQFFRALIRVLEHGAPADEVDELLGQLFSL